MPDPLDLIHLRTLVAIADCGGFHRAAAALRVSQSTVSQHVRLLERRLKEPLVEKAGRGVRFTVHGEALLVEARRILAVHDESLRRLEVVAERVILVGCTEHAADRMLPQLLAAMRHGFPGRSVRFRIDRSTQLAQGVARGTLDLAVVLAGAEPLGTPVAQLPLHWYGAPQFAPPEGDDPWPVVAFEEPCGLRQRALQALDLDGRVSTITAEATSLDGVVAAVRAGLGVALLPSTGRTPAGLVALPELPDVGTVGLHVAARRGIDPELEHAACEVSREFFASPRLRSVA
ncbi:LysR substrate-binding domain-containing protein [Dactylosporangium sp. NPDC000244]|uniref:LysR substrate-binding domain-containing protein n=1 Tax=Dactylosporangium sp. NPDC000244 TaxID=3154365 RepID=UPI003333E7E0|nr:LysR family transcriptional regulator [Dactylosporangium thailandense]